MFRWNKNSRCKFLPALWWKKNCRRQAVQQVIGKKLHISLAFVLLKYPNTLQAHRVLFRHANIRKCEDLLLQGAQKGHKKFLLSK
jgi:hypothetical protein